MKEVIMPKFGFTQEEGEILEWMVKEGDKVDQGDPLALVSTDKVSMEVEAPEAGIVAGLQYKQGETVPVTKIIAYLLKPGESLPSPAGTGSTQSIAAVKTAAPQPEPVPAHPPEMVSGLLTPVAARMVKDLGLDASAIPGSGPAGRVTREDVEKFAAHLSQDALETQDSDKVRATPAARRLAREKDLALENVHGSGPGGRVQAADVQGAAEKKAPAVGMPVKKAAPAPASGVRSIPFEGMRKAIALNMAHSAQTIPSIQLEIDVDMEAALALHEQAKLRAGEKKVSLTALIVKAVAWALSRNPMLNARLGENEILLLPDINIGVAVALESGLIVPVIHNADRKGVLQLAEEINDVSARARQNKLRSSDLEGGTFTISNLGMFGIDRFTAIINPPQVGILAVSAAKKQFVANEMGHPVLHSLMNIRLSADHRVVDGAEAARFLFDLRNGIEHPAEMLL